MRSRPEVTVHYKPAVVRPGDTLTVDVDLVSHGETPVTGMTLTLRGVEGLSDPSESLLRHVFFALVAPFPATVLAPGTHTRSAVFEIPAVAPPTVRPTDIVDGLQLRTDYEIQVHVDIPWWPDVRKAFVLVIDPKSEDEPGAASKSARGELAGPSGEALAFHAWIERATLRPGEALCGHVVFPRFPEGEGVDIRVTFEASGRVARPNAPLEGKIASYGAPVLRRAPVSGEPVDFTVILPSGAPPSYRGSAAELAWSVEVRLQAAPESVAVLRFPIEVLPSNSDAGARRGESSEIVHLGAERRAAVWDEVAEKVGLVHDRAGDRLRLEEGDVRLSISVEDGAEGQLTVARLAWPPVGMDLRVGPRRLAGVLRGRVATGDRGFDDHYQVEAREARQALALLRGEVRRALLGLEEANVTIDDAGARIAIGGNARDAASFTRFASLARALLEAMDRALPRVPVPAALAGAEEAWRRAAARLGGRWAPGGPWIHDGRWDEAIVAVGIVWDPNGLAKGTALRMRLDPPLGAAVDPRAPDGKLSRAALSRIEALGEKVQEAVFGPDAIEVTRAAATLDPEDVLPLFEEMAAVAAALQGRLEGPYR